MIFSSPITNKQKFRNLVSKLSDLLNTFSDGIYQSTYPKNSNVSIQNDYDNSNRSIKFKLIIMIQSMF